jgi:hypothetical protein
VDDKQKKTIKARDGAGKLALPPLFSQGYGQAPKVAFLDEAPGMNRGIEKAVFGLICSFTGGGDTCFPGIDRIGRAMRRARPAVIRAIKELEGQGYISVERRPGKPNVYRINFDKGPALRLEAEEGGNASVTGGVMPTLRVGSCTRYPIMNTHYQQPLLSVEGRKTGLLVGKGVEEKRPEGPEAGCEVYARVKNVARGPLSLYCRHLRAKGWCPEGDPKRCMGYFNQVKRALADQGFRMEGADGSPGYWAAFVNKVKDLVFKDAETLSQIARDKSRREPERAEERREAE